MATIYLHIMRIILHYIVFGQPLGLVLLLVFQSSIIFGISSIVPPPLVSQPFLFKLVKLFGLQIIKKELQALFIPLKEDKVKEHSSSLSTVAFILLRQPLDSSNGKLVFLLVLGS
jgi:hypothetical protein